MEREEGIQRDRRRTIGNAKRHCLLYVGKNLLPSYLVSRCVAVETRYEGKPCALFALTLLVELFGRACFSEVAVLSGTAR